MTSTYTDRDNLRWKDDEALIGIVWQYTAERMSYKITVEGVNAPSDPSAIVYQNGTDVTATVMPSGSHSVNGQVITLKRLGFLWDRTDYSVIITATISGFVQNRELIVQCLDRRAGRAGLKGENGYNDRRTLIWKLDDPEIGVVFQFPTETISYQIAVEGSSPPTTIAASAYRDDNLTNLVGAPTPEPTDIMLFTDSFSVSGQVITLKPLFNLIAGSVYSILIRTVILEDIRQNKLIVMCVDPKAT